MLIGATKLNRGENSGVIGNRYLRKDSRILTNPTKIITISINRMSAILLILQLLFHSIFPTFIVIGLIVGGELLIIHFISKDEDFFY